MSHSRTAAALLALALVGAGWATPASAAPPSTTTLVLSTPASAYGQTVTASAHVDTAGGPAEGDVVFTIDGTVIKTNLRADGNATAVLPRALVGEHPVSATFVPQFPDRQTSSTSPVVPWVVSQVRTRLQVRVTGRGARVPTSVVVVAAGEYGTGPTGRVKVKVRRDGSRRWTKVVQRLSSNETVTAGFGKLGGGRYRLMVTYVGDSQHLAERDSERFAVRQR